MGVGLILFFLVLTATLTLVSTGKLDLATTLVAPLAISLLGGDKVFWLAMMIVNFRRCVTEGLMPD